MSLTSLLSRAVLAGLLLFSVLAGSGCARNLGAIIRTGPDDPGERIVGLYPCETGRTDVAQLDATRPLTVLVHGCTSSGARFRTLAQVFEAHDQQTICFNYNDRDSLNTSATQLAIALSALERRWEPHQMTVLGHSQGGLIARRALQSDLPRPLVTGEGFSYRLVTVSSPFNGIASSADCSLVWLHVVTLSTTVAVCMAIAGNKWNEIPPGSGFMTNPAPLVDEVTDHLQIVTDERGSCRAYDAQGRCESVDFVFGLGEQYAEVLSSDGRVTTMELEVGHAAAVGENLVPPRLLVDALQQHGILAPTPPAQQAQIVALLDRLYRR